MRAREKTIEFLKWMVEQYSPSHHEHVFSRSLAEHLERRGWRAHTDEVGNTIASMGEGDTCIALLGWCVSQKRSRKRRVGWAAAAVTIAMALNVVATWEVQRSGERERPFTRGVEAHTPVQACEPATCRGA